MADEGIVQVRADELEELTKRWEARIKRQRDALDRLSGIIEYTRGVLNNPNLSPEQKLAQIDGKVP